MHAAATDHLHHPVAGLLRAETAFDQAAVRLRQLDRVLQAEEVGRVQQVGVQHVALDPLAAVEQAA